MSRYHVCYLCAELRQLSEAYVPVIKFTYEEIEVDLTFARLNYPLVPMDERELLVRNIFNVSCCVSGSV